MLVKYFVHRKISEKTKSRNDDNERFCIHAIRNLLPITILKSAFSNCNTGISFHSVVQNIFPIPPFFQLYTCTKYEIPYTTMYKSCSMSMHVYKFSNSVKWSANIVIFHEIFNEKSKLILVKFVTC